MAKTLEIKIPEAFRNEIQRANIEKDAYRDILVYILTLEDIKISQDRIDKYWETYYEKYKKFEDLKIKLEKEYIQSLNINNFSTWSLDYDSCIIKVEINEN